MAEVCPVAQISTRDFMKEGFGAEHLLHKIFSSSGRFQVSMGGSKYYTEGVTIARPGRTNP